MMVVTCTVRIVRRLHDRSTGGSKTLHLKLKPRVDVSLTESFVLHGALLLPAEALTCVGRASHDTATSSIHPTKPPTERSMLGCHMSFSVEHLPAITSAPSTDNTHVVPLAMRATWCHVPGVITASTTLAFAKVPAKAPVKLAAGVDSSRAGPFQTSEENLKKVSQLLKMPKTSEFQLPMPLRHVSTNTLASIVTEFV